MVEREQVSGAFRWNLRPQSRNPLQQPFQRLYVEFTSLFTPRAQTLYGRRKVINVFFDPPLLQGKILGLSDNCVLYFIL